MQAAELLHALRESRPRSFQEEVAMVRANIDTDDTPDWFRATPYVGIAVANRIFVRADQILGALSVVEQQPNPPHSAASIASLLDASTYSQSRNDLTEALLSNLYWYLLYHQKATNPEIAKGKVLREFGTAMTQRLQNHSGAISGAVGQGGDAGIEALFRVADSALLPRNDDELDRAFSRLDNVDIADETLESLVRRFANVGHSSGVQEPEQLKAFFKRLGKAKDAGVFEKMFSVHLTNTYLRKKSTFLTVQALESAFREDGAATTKLSSYFVTPPVDRRGGGGDAGRQRRFGQASANAAEEGDDVRIVEVDSLSAGDISAAVAKGMQGPVDQMSALFQNAGLGGESSGANSAAPDPDRVPPRWDSVEKRGRRPLPGPVDILGVREHNLIPIFNFGKLPRSGRLGVDCPACKLRPQGAPTVSYKGGKEYEAQFNSVPYGRNSTRPLLDNEVIEHDIHWCPSLWRSLWEHMDANADSKGNYKYARFCQPIEHTEVKRQVSALLL